MSDSLRDPAFPHRPNTPDFWRISEILLRNDGALEEAESSDQGRDEVFTRLVEEIGDTASVVYVATQRAMRMCGVVNRGDLMARAGEVARLSALWMDAFVAGAQFERRGGHRDA